MTKQRYTVNKMKQVIGKIHTVHSSLWNNSNAYDDEIEAIVGILGGKDTSDIPRAEVNGKRPCNGMQCTKILPAQDQSILGYSNHVADIMNSLGEEKTPNAAQVEALDQAFTHMKECFETLLNTKTYHSASKRREDGKTRFKTDMVSAHGHIVKIQSCIRLCDAVLSGMINHAPITYIMDGRSAAQIQ